MYTTSYTVQQKNKLIVKEYKVSCVYCTVLECFLAICYHALVQFLITNGFLVHKFAIDRAAMSFLLQGAINLQQIYDAIL